MENISPVTRILGKPVHYVAVCDSTNSVALELLNKNEATEGCVIVAGQQTAGRGQRGNSWEAEADQNITLSVVLKPIFLVASSQFFLNMAVSLGVLDFLKRLLPSGVGLKWPNDIYYQGKKLGGILIENSITGNFLQSSVVGIGLNINQLQFSNTHAVSVAQIIGRNLGLKTLIESLLEALEKRYLELQKTPKSVLKHEYWQHLLGFQEFRNFEVNGKVLAGKILGTDEIGRLQVEISGQVQVFDLKEIRFLFV